MNAVTELLCYPFAVKWNKNVGSCNTLNDLSNKVCVPNKIEDLNSSMFKVITGMHDSNILAKDISCKCKCRFDGKKCDSDQWWKNGRYWYECKNGPECEKDYIWNPATCSCENGKYQASIMDDSVITCDEIIEYIQRRNKNYFIKF